jgi:predicted Fe-S protein YdhL (DUF1289 family)
MIKEITMYQIICNGCGVESTNGDEIIAWIDKFTAKDVAMMNDWVSEDEKHYCSGCVQYPIGEREAKG